MGEEVKHRLTIIQLKSAYVGAQSLQSCLTLCDLMDFSPPGSLVYGTFPIRILEWVVLFSSRKCSPPRDGTHISCISCIAGGFFSAEPRGSPRWRVTDSIIKKKKNISFSFSVCASIWIFSVDLCSNLPLCLYFFAVYNLRLH